MSVLETIPCVRCGIDTITGYCSPECRNGTPPPTPSPQARAMTERELQDATIAYAALHGWLVYHTYDSRRSHPGFPDLALTRNGTLLLTELKTEKGRLTEPQQLWKEQLETIHTTRYHLWRPTDWLDGTIDTHLDRSNP